MFIDGSMMLTNICKTLPDLKTALTKFTTWKLVNKTEYAAVINGSKLRDDMQPLDNNAQWAVDQSFTPIALLLEAYHSPSGCFDDCHGTCRVYSKVNQNLLSFTSNRLINGNGYSNRLQQWWTLLPSTP